MTPQPDTPWDLIVVGGGASGFFAAIACAESFLAQEKKAHILILEKSSHVLGKVKISGGGRCNLTHACFDPKELCQYYPRGHQSLIGPFYQWGPAETIEWFQTRGVPLKTEPDGRVFPASDLSQTVINTLIQAALDAGITIQTSHGVCSIQKQTETTPFHLQIQNSNQPSDNPPKDYFASAVILATGGTRSTSGAKLASSLGHQLTPDHPSLFAFHITDKRLQSIAGLSVQHATLSIPDSPFSSEGPLLITHQGLSGPAVLKLSAWAARWIAEHHYSFPLKISWHNNTASETQKSFSNMRTKHPKRLVSSHSAIDGIPKRLWKNLCDTAHIPPTCQWAQLPKNLTNTLLQELNNGTYIVAGKSINKDEFVTCGGVPLREVNLKTMESKITPRLYLTGEILDIDGVTGGFNFQNAWTTGFIAGNAIASRVAKS